jgi:hypothetical protein
VKKNATRNSSRRSRPCGGTIPVLLFQKLDSMGFPMGGKLAINTPIAANLNLLFQSVSLLRYVFIATILQQTCDEINYSLILIILDIFYKNKTKAL